MPGAVTVTPASGSCRWTETLHVPAPPPASVSATERVAVVERCTRPNETVVGESKISGVFARGMLITPPPSRVVGASTVLVVLE